MEGGQEKCIHHERRDCCLEIREWKKKGVEMGATSVKNGIKVIQGKKPQKWEKSSLLEERSKG